MNRPLGFIYIGESENDIASRCVHRASNMMFTFSSDKDHRKKFAFAQYKWTITGGVQWQEQIFRAGTPTYYFGQFFPKRFWQWWWEEHVWIMTSGENILHLTLLIQLSNHLQRHYSYTPQEWLIQQSQFAIFETILKSPFTPVIY